MRFSKILMLVISMIFMWNTRAEAISFQFPHPDMGPDSCLSWLEATTSGDFKGECHLADDFCLPEGTLIYPTATGIVRYAGQNGSASDGSGWGYLIVIEHTLEDGSKINTVYGHVKPQNGITAGATITDITQSIGTIIYHKYGDHIHFGIYKGDYGTSTGTYSSKVKGYDGVCTGTSAPSSDTEEYKNYLDPYTFIFQHSIGYLSTGPSSYKDAFQGTYFNEGINKSYPYPTNYVHDWAYTQVQDLCKENKGINGTCPTDKNAMLMRNPNTGNVALLKGGFWSLWNDFRTLTGGEIGYPKSSEQADPLVTGGVLQHFDKGIFYWDPTNRLASATMDSDGKDYRFCWNGTSFQTTSAYSCPQVAMASDWISSVVSRDTILSAYGGGGNNVPYTPPAGTGGCTATAPNLSYFLDKGDTRSITTTPEGDIYAVTDTVYKNCQSTRNFYLSHDQGLTWEIVTLSGEPNPETIALFPLLQHSLGFYLTNGNIGFLQGGTLYTLPKGTGLFDIFQISFWDADTYFYSGHYSSRYYDVCLVDAGRETCGWGSTYSHAFFMGESAGKPIIFSDYYQELTYRKESYGTRYSTGVREYGDIHSLIEDPTDPNKFLIFFQGGGLWEGRTDASSFKRLGTAPTSNWYNPSASVLKGNPKDPNILYLTYWGKMYRTEDRGKTWKEVFTSEAGIGAMDVSWDGKIVYMHTGKITPWAEPKFAN